VVITRLISLLDILYVDGALYLCIILRAGTHLDAEYTMVLNTLWY